MRESTPPLMPKRMSVSSRSPTISTRLLSRISYLKRKKKEKCSEETVLSIVSHGDRVVSSLFVFSLYTPLHFLLLNDDIEEGSLWLSQHNRLFASTGLDHRNHRTRSFEKTIRRVRKERSPALPTVVMYRCRSLAVSLLSSLSSLSTWQNSRRRKAAVCVRCDKYTALVL